MVVQKKRSGDCKYDKESNSLNHGYLDKCHGSLAQIYLSVSQNDGSSVSGLLNNC